MPVHRRNIMLRTSFRDAVGQGVKPWCPSVPQTQKCAVRVYARRRVIFCASRRLFYGLIFFVLVWGPSVKGPNRGLGRFGPVQTSFGLIVLVVGYLRCTKLWWVGKQNNTKYFMKPTNSRTQGQPNRRKSRLKVAFGPLVPTANIFFRGMGLIPSSRKQTTRNLTQPSSSRTPCGAGGRSFEGSKPRFWVRQDLF